MQGAQLRRGACSYWSVKSYKNLGIMSPDKSNSVSRTSYHGQSRCQSQHYKRLLKQEPVLPGSGDDNSAGGIMNVPLNTRLFLKSVKSTSLWSDTLKWQEIMSLTQESRMGAKKNVWFLLVVS